MASAVNVPFFLAYVDTALTEIMPVDPDIWDSSGRLRVRPGNIRLQDTIYNPVLQYIAMGYCVIFV